MAGNGHQPEPTADECVRAGMYWFGRSDFDAAQAWWERAIELDPHHTRAHECLRLLNKTSSTGFKSDAVNPFQEPVRSPGPRGLDFPGRHPSSDDLQLDPQPPRGGVDRPPGFMGPGQSSGRHTPVPPPSDPTDPFDFAADGQHPTHSSGVPPPPVGVTRSPWDEGPSRTSVVTLHDSGGFDAVPEPTPLPEIDRERFFGRGDPESDGEIVSFLRATGDLPPIADMDRSDEIAAFVDDEASGEIVFDDPVELPPEVPEAAPLPDPKVLLKEARDRFGLHDFDGVLERLEQLPADLAQSDEVKSLAAEARRNLLKMYESKIGDFERVPAVQISDEEVIWLNLNHRAGFILSQIDGTVSYEDLISLSGMPRLDTVRILADLIDKHVVK